MQCAYDGDPQKAKSSSHCARHCTNKVPMVERLQSEEMKSRVGSLVTATQLFPTRKDFVLSFQNDARIFFWGVLYAR